MQTYEQTHSLNTHNNTYTHSRTHWYTKTQRQRCIWSAALRGPCPAPRLLHYTTRVNWFEAFSQPSPKPWQRSTLSLRHTYTHTNLTLELHIQKYTVNQQAYVYLRAHTVRSDQSLKHFMDTKKVQKVARLPRWWECVGCWANRSQRNVPDMKESLRDGLIVQSCVHSKESSFTF